MEIKIPVDGGYSVIYILDEKLQEMYRKDPEAIERQFQTCLSVAFEYLIVGEITRYLLDRLEVDVAKSRKEIIEVGSSSERNIAEGNLVGRVDDEYSIDSGVDDEDSD